MRYIIYLDMLFLVNFVMDYAVVSLTAYILCRMKASGKVPVKSRGIKEEISCCLKKILASVVGALWVCIMLFFRLTNPLWNIVTYIPVAALMVIIISDRFNFKLILKGLLILYSVTFFLGGFIHVLYYYTTLGYMINVLGRDKEKTASALLVFGGVIIAAPFLKLFIKALSMKLSDAGNKRNIIIENDGKKVRITALWDTGNSLTDPLLKEPVSVVLSDCVRELMESEFSCGYHLIPYTSIGSEKGVLPVVRFEKLTVLGEKEIHVINKPLFALYAGKFAESTDYKAILNPMICRTKG